MDENQEKLEKMLKSVLVEQTKQMTQDMENQEQPTNVDVTCVVCTKDRYFSTLPCCLMAIAQQTYKPKTLIIFDDSNEFKPVGNVEPIYRTIFDYLLIQGIYWYHEPGRKMGQVYSHIKSLQLAKTEWIWRVDDDEVPEKDVLEKLIRNIRNDVGAIAGLVLPAGSAAPMPRIVQNKIEDIYLGFNEQWYLHLDGARPKEVDHLYSSFLYRKSIAKYNTDLSVVCHREETLLTFEMRLKGFKNIIDPSARTWHFRNPSGGIRSHDDVSYFSHDERVFSNKLNEWGVKPTDFSHVVLDNGIGDHYIFKSILHEYFEKNKNKKNIFYVCFPEVFEDVPNITLCSIMEAKILFGESLNSFNTYKLMWDCNWKQHILKAFREVYHLEEIERKQVIESGKGNTIVLSPYSQSTDNPKSYPFWKELVPLLKTLGYKIIQIGKKGEEELQQVDEISFNRTFKEIEELIRNCRFWISVDNFLQHLCNNMEKVIRGVVIFSESDPELFGYSYNKNILKSRKFLRSQQFGEWYDIVDKLDENQKPIKVRVVQKQHLEYFNRPEEIFVEIKKFLNEK